MATWIFIFTIITISFPVSDQSTPSTGQTGAPIMLIPGSGVSVPSDPRGPDGLPIILSTEAPNDEQSNPDQTTIGPNAQVTGPGGRPIRLIPESKGSISVT
ncbi:uncharacterized protein LOC107369212 isoform X2 [Tetranychus urticae]|uniref:uncharacterized protein LOC107369212 isoform X2 n=1 Tax=Tetranychus urticae TaxID=32264 RepID=UPI00077BED17|nr:uncharacterized protein LOC107369212 isoform X2 [Tetranychus urticae]